MPDQPLNPAALQRLARKLLDIPADFTSAKTRGPVSPASVPEDVRIRLENARNSLLLEIINSPDFADRLNRAVKAEDKNVLVELGRSARTDTEVDIRLVGVDGDFWAVFGGCLFGFCFSIAFGW